jgi:hemolysin III
MQILKPQASAETALPKVTLDRQEVFNTVTHAVGIALSIAAAIVLLSYTFVVGDAWRILGCAVFTVTLVGVYTASTLSHCVRDARRRTFFRKLDQALIYLLIAGSYSPFALLYLRFSWWWCLFVTMWLLAIWGFAAKMFCQRHQLTSLRTYLLLGWLPIIPAYKYFEYVPLGALTWVLVGGLYYSVGVIFLFLDYKRYYFHAIWHTFVIAGSTCHFFGVLIFVACAPQL